MERQHQYRPGITAQAGNLREGRVDAPPQGEGAGSGILRAVMALGGEVMNVIAKDYAREMRGRMDDSILRTNAEFEKWKTEYKRTRQGVDALTAQKDFADKYMELADRAVADFGGNGNEIYIGDLKREYAKYGLYAVKEGGAYQLQQDEAWQKSQWVAQLSSFQKIVDDNPNDADMLNMEAQTLLQSWLAKNPGKDPGAIRDQIQSMLANGRMQSLLARKDYEGAERLLGGGGEESKLQAQGAETSMAQSGCPSLPGLTAVEIMRYQTQIAEGREKQFKETQKLELNNFLGNTAELAPEERLGLAKQQYGRDPESRQMYMAAVQGIRADESAREYIRKKREKRQEQQTFRQLQAFSELPDMARGWQEARSLIEQMPIEQRGKYYTAFSNLREQAAVDDPAAVDEVTEKIANGEDFNIRAEYGGRLSNRTIEKFNREAFKKALPEIKTAFDNAALEWLGDAGNKNHEKEFGYTTVGGLWTRFLDGTDADEKLDANRLRKKANEFFKQVVLDRGWLRKDVETIRGLQGMVLDKYDDARRCRFDHEGDGRECDA